MTIASRKATLYIELTLNSGRGLRFPAGLASEMQKNTYICSMIYRTIRTTLSQGGMEEGEARTIALLLLEKVCGMSTAEALSGSEKGDGHEAELKEMAERIARGEPVQYVLGEADFCGLRLSVEPGVLIPRCETEELVEWAAESFEPAGAGRVLDIGTGSGCIAIALARRLPGVQVEAWDVSEKALQIARHNALTNEAAVAFRLVDVLKEDGNDGPLFDMIVSNPPYICEEEAEEMEANVLEHEPGLALFVPDSDPLLFYRRIAALGLRMLTEEGLLFFEINRRFGQETVLMLQGMGYREVELRKDLYGNDRMVKAIKG